MVWVYNDLLKIKCQYYVIHSTKIQVEVSVEFQVYFQINEDRAVFGPVVL